MQLYSAATLLWLVWLLGLENRSTCQYYLSILSYFIFIIIVIPPPCDFFTSFFSSCAYSDTDSLQKVFESFLLFCFFLFRTFSYEFYQVSFVVYERIIIICGYKFWHESWERTNLLAWWMVLRVIHVQQRKHLKNIGI